MKVKLQGFRGINSNGIEVELSPLTILTGKNSSGKSTFLKVIELLSNINYISNDSPHQEVNLNTELYGGASSFVNENIDESISASFYVDTTFFSSDLYVKVNFERDRDELIVGAIELRSRDADEILCYKHATPIIVLPTFVSAYMKRARPYNQMAEYLYEHNDEIISNGIEKFYTQLQLRYSIDESISEHWAKKILTNPSSYIFKPTHYVSKAHNDYKAFLDGEMKFFSAPEMAFLYLDFDSFKNKFTKVAEDFTFSIDHPEFLSHEFYRALYALYIESIWEKSPSFNKSYKDSEFHRFYGEIHDILSPEDMIPFKFYSLKAKTEFTTEELKSAISLRSRIRIEDKNGNHEYIDSLFERLGSGVDGDDQRMAAEIFEVFANKYFKKVQGFIGSLASYAASKHEARRSYNLYRDDGYISSFLKVLPSLEKKSVIKLIDWINHKLKMLDYPGSLSIDHKSGVGFLYYRQGEIKTTLIDEGTGTAQFINMLMFLALCLQGLPSRNKSTDPMWGNIFAAPLRNANIIVLEEPETSLHPSIQSNLANLLVALKKESNKTIIIETHSEYLIRKLQFLVAKEELNADDVTINYFQKDYEGNQSISTYPISIDKNGHLSRQLGPGFLDEADRLSMDLFDLNQQKAN